MYIHIPFCSHRCHYCDFNTYVGKNSFIPAYVDALIKELQIIHQTKPDLHINTIYFGGGTPSLIPVSLYQSLLHEIETLYSLTADCEISIEANPGTLSHAYLNDLLETGFNRISIGVQSTDSFDLTRLDRIHTIWDVLETVKNVRKVGFENFNLDMIFGLPWQNLKSWENSLSRAIQLNPSHFSIYSLIIEPGTPLFEWYQKGLIKPQDQDLEGDMYALTIEMLDHAGYEHYEISNWAKASTVMDYRCQHNLQYWLGYPYLGIGAGAHGYANNFRTVNTPTIRAYIQSLRSKPIVDKPFPATSAQISTKEIDKYTQMQEFMMVGFRLVKMGVSDQRFHQLFGCSMFEVFHEEIDALLAKELVAWSDENHLSLHLTDRGIMVANQVFMYFV
jgi:oxygen-independent coproporphyrinogen-3 oxidase